MKNSSFDMSDIRGRKVGRLKIQYPVNVNSGKLERENTEEVADALLSLQGATSHLSGSPAEFKEPVLPMYLHPPQHEEITDDSTGLKTSQTFTNSAQYGATTIDNCDSSVSSSLWATPKDEILPDLLPHEIIVDLQRRLHFVKSHYLEPALHSILTNSEQLDGNVVISKTELQHVQDLHLNEGVINDGGKYPSTNEAGAFVMPTRPRHGSLLDFLGEAFRSSDFQRNFVSDAPNEEAELSTKKTRLRRTDSAKDDIEHVLQVTSESKEMEHRIQQRLRKVLHTVSDVRPVTEQELSLRMKRIEEPFDFLERLLNEHVQLLLEEISTDTQISMSLGQGNSSSNWRAVQSGTITTEHDGDSKDSLGVPRIPNTKLPQKRYPKHVQKILYEWLRTHFDHPYPTKAEKDEIARTAGISADQVGQWFTNARRRIWKPFKSSIDAIPSNRPASSSVGSNEE